MNKVYGIIAAIMFILVFAYAGKADFEIEMGNSHKVNATVMTVVVLEDGNEYITETETKVVTVYDHDSDDPRNWSIKH